MDSAGGNKTLFTVLPPIERLLFIEFAEIGVNWWLSNLIPLYCVGPLITVVEL